jgi:glycosyltransferase involved in cell wall biosynthesis
LRSILGLKGGYPLEIIVIDDASKDGTEAVVKSFADPRIRYIRHEKNWGAMATVNHGFAEARGEFVARIDSDDRYRPEFLERSIPVLQREPKVGLVYGDIALIYTDGQITVPGGNVVRRGRPVQGNEFAALLEENFVPAPSTIARRVAWQQALPVPADFGFADWYLSLGIAQHWDFYFVESVLADYRMHTTNMHRTMIRDLSGEKTAFRILDAKFSNGSPVAKDRALKDRVYGVQYLAHADKYFGSQMNEHARRCYWQAIRHRPRYLLNPAIMRRFAASLTSRRAYETAKSWFK